MHRICNLSLGTRAVLGTSFLLLFLLPGQAAAARGSLSAEFHQSYPLNPGGRIELDNINGAVHITAWDRDQVKLDAVKYANSQQRLDEAVIEVDANASRISVHTRYPDHNQTFGDSSGDGPASVEYTLTVPRSANLDEINLVNGPLDMEGVAGQVRASCVNGHLSAHNLEGGARLSTVNGRLEAEFSRVETSPLELSSVNGSVELTLPSDAKAEIEASTVSGGIRNEFGLHPVHHALVGHSLRGELGEGGARIQLTNVNGGIEIQHAKDGRTVSPAKDLEHADGEDGAPI